MEDVTGLLLIGGLAVATVLGVAVYRSKRGLPMLPTISPFRPEAAWVPISPPKALVPILPEVKPVEAEIMGPFIPTGLVDELDYSKIDYLPSSSPYGNPQRIVQDFWTKAKQHNKLIWKYSTLYGLPANFIRAIIYRESSGISYPPKDPPRHTATGLMQIVLPTARTLGYTGDNLGLMDPETNIKLGTRYLSNQYKRYGKSFEDAAASYNWGSVFRWGQGKVDVPKIDFAVALQRSKTNEGIFRLNSTYNHALYGAYGNFWYVRDVMYWYNAFNKVIVRI